MLRGLLVRLLLAGAVHAQRVENDQQVFYGLAYRQCEQGLFDERESPSDGRRLLRQSTRGAACQDEHVGVSLNASCCCYADMGRSDLQASCPVEYDPIRSAIGGGDFGFNMTAGLTIEVWVKPAVLEPYVPGGTTSSMILALSAEAAAADCAGGGSFALRQTSRGCVILEANTAAGCLTLPQNENYCFSQTKKLDLESPRRQHVVVTLSSRLEPGAHVAGTPPRFAIYIDGEAVVDTDADPPLGTSLGSADAALTLGVTFGAATFAPFEPQTLWPSAHVLRVGSLGAYKDRVRAWQGEVDMIALHGRPLTQDEVSTNFAANIPNSAPFASDFEVVAAEDVCTLLPNFATEGEIRDWDIRGPLGRSQTLSINVDASSLSRGGLYTNSSCTGPKLAGVVGYAEPLYFASDPDDESGGERYATLTWTVHDDDPHTPASGEARVRFNVSAVNDAPVAGSGSPPFVYMGLATALHLNGSDIDSPMANASSRIVDFPRCGALYAVGADGRKTGSPLGGSPTVGDCLRASRETAPAPIDVSGTTVVYESTYPFATSGLQAVGSDSFTFRIIDSDGEPSEGVGTYHISILNGLEAFNRQKVAEEEESTAISLKGINQKAAFAAFTITSFPENGKLYQCRPAGASQSCSLEYETLVPINASSPRVLDANNCSESDGGSAFKCPRLVYRGDLDFFSIPAVTRAGAPLNNSADSFTYTVGDGEGNGTEVSAPATVTIDVNNVVDAPTLRAGLPNASYAPRAENFVFRGVSIVDPDRGVGAYRVSFVAVGEGDFSEAMHIQKTENDPSWDKYQWTASSARALLGYCPELCDGGARCTSSCQLAGNGRTDSTLRVISSPQTTELLLHDIIYNAPPFTTTGTQAVQLTIEAFDRGEGLGDIQTESSADLKAVKATEWEGLPAGLDTFQLDLYRQEGSCTKITTGACGDADLGGSSGLVSWIGAGAALGLSLILCIWTCNRQRGRMKKKGPDGAKRPACQRGRDMRLGVPLTCVLALFCLLVFYALRCGASPYTLFRLDFYGDGTCGDDATKYDENHGCTAGVPEGFMFSHCLGDVLVLGLAFPIVMLELDGRYRCRLTCAAWAFVWFVYALVKSIVFVMWENNVPELPWVAVPGDEYHIQLGDEKRPLQNSFAALIMLLLWGPPMIILFIVGVSACADRLVGGDDDSSEEESNESDEEYGSKRRRRRKDSYTKTSTTSKSHRDSPSSKKKKKKAADEESHGGRGDKPAPPSRPKPAPPSRPKPAPPSRPNPHQSIEIGLPAPPPPPPPSVPLPLAVDHVQLDPVEWYYMDFSGNVQGPVYEDEMRQLYANCTITGATSVWTEAFPSGWTTVDSEECQCRIQLLSGAGGGYISNY